MPEQKPLYHFRPPSNWINDPNGLIHWDGRYHLFYQYDPYSPLGITTKHWGHAVSEDLVHWEIMPIALAPTPGGPDEDGCWSGCAINKDGIPTIIYTGIKGRENRQETVCVSQSHDDSLVKWDKYHGNPVISSPPENIELVGGFRDPYVWREGDSWYLIIGSGIKNVGGTVFLYKSQDLINWTYLSSIYTRNQKETDPIWTGLMWECPQFFPLNDQYVLIVSVRDNEKLYYPVYFTGTYEEYKFEPQALRRLDSGADYYAPAVMFDDKGRCIVFGWSWEGWNEEAIQAVGWSGVMSLPRLVSLRSDGLLNIEPVPELNCLRKNNYCIFEFDLSSSYIDLPVYGDCMEIAVEYELDSANEFGLCVRRSPNGEEQTAIVYDAISNNLFINRDQSSLDDRAYHGVHGGPLRLNDKESLNLRVFLDRSIIEVYANNQMCITERVYPSRDDSLGIRLFSKGGKTRVKSVELWEMKL